MYSDTTYIEYIDISYMPQRQTRWAPIEIYSEWAKMKKL